MLEVLSRCGAPFYHNPLVLHSALMRHALLLIATALTLTPGSPAVAQSDLPLPSSNPQQPAPLPHSTVKKEADTATPLLPGEIQFLPLPPEETIVSPSFKLKLAQDAMTPILPPVDFSQLPAAATSLSLVVKRFEFSGNTVFSTTDLQKVVAHYTQRRITAEELEAARIEITRLYVDAGYINSGAILPDQDVESGVVQFEIVEGKLSDIELSGNRWFRSFWLLKKLRQAAGNPVNFYKLRTGLQLLRQNPGISRINSELKPGAQPGESILHTTIKDASPFRLDLEVNNKRPPSVGEGAIEAHFADLNLLGINDPFDLRWGLGQWTKQGALRSSAIDNIAASYEFPFTPWDTTLGLHFSKNDSSVLDETFALLGITSQSTEYGLSLRQPLHQSLSNNVSVSLSAERKHTETTLLGSPFTLSPGAIDGKTDVFVTHLTFEWTNRSQIDVFSVRSSLNLGLHALGSTEASTKTSPTSLDPIPDSKFTSWLGQAQYIRRIFDTAHFAKRPNTYEWNVIKETTLLLRANAQLSADALLSMEQFSLGGVQSVRGYRENQLLRDNGVFASVELRIPIWMRSEKTPVVSVAPFFDFGTGWDSEKKNTDSKTIYSTGMGLIVTPSKNVQAMLYVGHPLVKLSSKHESLQDYGIHLSVSISAF